MAEHQLEKHENCDKQHCHICDGGLAHCLVCRGFEGTLTEECSGEKLTPQQASDIYAGKIDFKGGKWV